MARVVVDVMPKPEILDPQGKAVTGALARLGFAGVTVRQGKRFELDVAGELTEDRLAEIHRAAETLLANTVIETFNVRVEGAETATNSDGLPSGGAAGDPREGRGEASDARVEERGETATDSDGRPSGGAAGDAPQGKGEAPDARVVEERGQRAADPHGRPPETVGDTPVQSPRGPASEPARGIDEVLDAGVKKPEETVEDSSTRQQDGIAPGAEAEPQDPAASGAR